MTGTDPSARRRSRCPTPSEIAVSLALGILVSGASPGDHGKENERVRELREVASPIRSVDPRDEDFSDLRPLAGALGDASVVILGESDHGSGRTFQANTRLVKFLHRELGFDVLAFESGFYDCRKAWERVEAGEDPESAFRRSVFPIWTRSEQIQPLVRYFAAAARSERPLELAGFDPQLTGEMSDRFLLEDLLRVGDSVGISREELASRVVEPLGNLLEGRYEEGEFPDEPARTGFLAAMAELEAEVRSARGAETPDRLFWLQWLEGIGPFARASWATDPSRNHLESPELYAVRDRLMGENLAWLASEAYPGRRIVVWMHGLHAARGLREVEAPSKVHMRLFETLKPAGEVARERLGDAVYVLGFLAYQGEYGTVFRESPIEIWKPTEGSLEDLFHRTGLEHAFLDLSHRSRLPRWLRGPVIARPMGYMEMRARWWTVYDGFLFLDRMDRSRPAPATGEARSDGRSR